MLAKLFSQAAIQAFKSTTHRACLGVADTEEAALCQRSSYPTNLYEDDWTAAQAVALLKRAPATQPWFLWVSFPGPHAPFAVTAPMATAYALNELMPPKAAASQIRRFRIISISIVAIGAAIALSGVNAVSLIIIAQAANGILLPVIAVFLLHVMNRRSLLGEMANGPLANLAGAVVVVVATLLGARGLWRAIETGLGTL